MIWLTRPEAMPPFWRAVLMALLALLLAPPRPLFPLLGAGVALAGVALAGAALAVGVLPPVLFQPVVTTVALPFTFSRAVPVLSVLGSMVKQVMYGKMPRMGDVTPPNVGRLPAACCSA